jgi:hypothetical protein
MPKRLRKKRKSWFEKLTHKQRIELARSKMKRVVDHFLYLIELHANNSYVVYSPALSSQIPTSFAANAFNVFQRSMYHFEIVRLCAMWDGTDPQKENIPTVVDLIANDAIIEMLAEDAGRPWAGGSGGSFINLPDDPEHREAIARAIKQTDAQFAAQVTARAKLQLTEVISDVRSILSSTQLESVMNLRHKHLAHSLTETRREKDGPIQPMKVGDETDLINRSISIIEKLYCWVNGTSFQISESQRIDQENAAALWKGCKFTVLQ